MHFVQVLDTEVEEEICSERYRNEEGGQQVKLWEI